MGDKFRIIALLLALALVLAGCGKPAEETTVLTTDAPTAAAEVPTTDAPTAAAEVPTTDAPTAAAEVPTTPSLQEAPFSLGSVEDGVYINRYAGFGCAPGQGWELSDAWALQELPQGLTAKMEGTEVLRLLEEYPVLRDVYAKNKAENTSFNLAYVRQDAASWLQFQPFPDEELVDLILEDRESREQAFRDMDMVLTSMEKVRVSFCGQDRWAVKMIGDAGGINYYVLQMVNYRLGTYGMTLTCTSLGEDKLQQVLDTFYAIE